MHVLKNKHSIGRQLLYKILIFSTFVTSVLTLVNMGIDYNTQIDKLDKTIGYIEKSALPAVGRALWNYDKEQILSHINGLTGVNYILNISVYDEFDTAFVSTSKPYEKDAYTEQRKFNLSIKRDGKERKLGYLNILLTKKFIYKDLIKKFAIFFVFQGLKTFLISFFILFIFYKLIGEAIFKISKQLEEMESGNLNLLDEKSWGKNPQSEIGALGRSINSLISQVKKTQEINIEKLQRSEEGLKRAQHISKLGSWKYYLDGRAPTWSEEMYNVFDVAQGQSPMLMKEHINAIHYEDIEKWRQAYNQILIDGEKIELRYRAFSANGTLKWLDVIAYADTNDRGQITSLWGTCQDITDRMMIQSELEEKQKLLNHSAKLASIGELAAGVGHEINNPLTIIRGSTVSMQRMMMKNKEFTKQELDKFFNKVVSVSDRISAIVNVLRTFSRTDDDLIVEFKPIEVLNESIELVKDLVKQSDVVINNNILDEHKDLVIKGNKGRLQQVFMNLLTNAKDACDNSDQKIISVSTELIGDKVQILFKDTGCGMSEATAQKIFDPFFTTKPVGSGTGIGLSLVHSIIEEFGGSIYVESTVDVGSTFFVGLKVVKETKESLHKDNKPVPFIIHEPLGHKVLVVDDEDDVREVLVGILEEMGMEVVSYRDALEALEHLKLNILKYDVVVTDMVMPQINGLEFLRRIKNIGSEDGPKLFIMSGGVNIDFESKTTELAKLSDGYFFKPFQEEEIYKVFSLREEALSES